MVFLFYKSVCRNNNNILVKRFLDSSRATLLLFMSTRFISNTPKSNQLSIDYLINSCGLSPESALKVSKTIFLKSTTTPDLVLSLFKTYNISKTHISKLITRYPKVLFADPDKSIRPKLEFLKSVGVSESNLGKIVSSDSNFWGRSLENQIIPSVNYVKSLVSSDSNIGLILNRSRWVLHDAESKMGPNIKILRDHGLKESSISKFIMMYPQKLYYQSCGFEKYVLLLNKMGISTSNGIFIYCLNVILSMKRSIWEEKLAVYKSYGWSEHEVLSAFQKMPFIMALSEKKIRLVLDFLLYTMKWTVGDIAKNPCILYFSLEKRIIPRAYVLQTLLSKNLINKGIIIRVFDIAEDDFLKRFVTKYQLEMPELIKLYYCRRSFKESKGGYEEKCLTE
ncbi:Mitochondrial transcription termination factor family protein [Thalictrum thalictroides]|uniref:Mitochondrial transcription termination factor family protein n=1 Tax=Thalictrum thalictroides TaxID=46969 RepID=A0A7J6UT58_THATH|nr:Mitochondrial transcription termination factor family protein [Thalictrum thalictroides]